MKHAFIHFLIFLSLLNASAFADEVYDIVVYGDTSAGVTAGIQAARMGKSVVLIAPTGKLGGMTASGLGATDIPDNKIVGGIAREFYQQIYDYYLDPTKWTTSMDRSSYFSSIINRVFTGKDDSLQMMWVFEPHVAQAVFEAMVTEAGVTLIRGERLDLVNGVTLNNGTIQSIRMEGGRVIGGSMFIDATYEGDLMAKAGITYTVGREPNSQYGETMNGILPEKIIGVDETSISPYITEGDPTSGILPYIEPEPLGPTGDGDHRVQAYCYRLTLTSNPDNRLPIEKPANYNPLWFEPLGRGLAIGSGEKLLTYTPMPNQKTDFNHCDFVGTNYDYPDADYARRAEIEQMHKDYALGRIWFLQNDPRVPADVRNAMNQFGLSSDEYTDTGHFPYQLYIREGRRMISDYVMREQDVRKQTQLEDSVGQASYWFDSHVVSYFLATDGKVWKEGQFWKSRYTYPISYRSIRPRKQECTNLLVPVCLSASHAAYGSIRMEPTYMVLGQSAATAAAQAIDQGVAVQDIDYNTLRYKLQDDGQIFSSTLQPPPSESLSNGDFETGDFSGWTLINGGKTIVTAGALEGTYSVQLVDEASGTLTQSFAPMTGSVTLSFVFSVTAPDASSNRPLNLSLRNADGFSFITLRLIDATLDGDGELEVYNGSNWVATGINSVAFGATNSFSLTIQNMSSTPGVSSFDLSIGSESVTGLTAFRSPNTPDSFDALFFSQSLLENSTLLLDNITVVSPISVQPEINSLTLSGITVTLQFTGMEGQTYGLNKSPLLQFSPPNIVDTTEVSGGTGTLLDTNATEAVAFYRVDSQ